MGILRRCLLVCVVVLAAAGTAIPHAEAVSNTERSAETYLASLIASGRSANHLGTLKEHSYIRGQTEAHSADMLARKTMDHTGFSTRVSNIRAHDTGMRYSGVCENVAAAWGYRDLQSAMRAINVGWQNSTDHRKCMYDQLGWTSQSAAIGVRYDGTTYWVTFITGHDTNP